MAETTTVFLSSTRQDLVPYRAAVDGALREAGLVAVLMESFGAREDLPLDLCLKEVRGADLFVGIYAWRYGFVPPGESVSITELEYGEACRQKKPCFCFLVDDNQSWPAENREPERAAELAAFKARLRAERVVATFTTPDDLAKRVVSALLRVERQRRELSAPEQRDLRTLLDRVESFWITKRLGESTLGGTLLAISREQQDQAVAQPFEGELAAAPVPLPDLPIRDLFESRGRELLILGAPGAGKTTTLLDLARGLVDLARKDPGQPIPVVLKLSAWSGAAKSLDDWLAGEVAKRFSFDRPTVAAWIAGRHLLPLLDGLDEAEPGLRAGCVAAINGYVVAHPGCGLAVTCRTAINEELTPRLRLQAAIALQPLRRDQVAGYLASHGSEADALATALREDPAWQELAESPLMLGMMDRVVRQAGPAALGAAPGTAPADRRRLLFSTFVAEMLKRPRGESTAARQEPEATTLSRLSWLARQMERQPCDPFQVEDLEPGWLAAPAQVWSYALASRAVVGVLLVLPLTVFSPALLLPFGLVGGALAGIADGARLRRSAPPATPTGKGGAGGRGLLLGGAVFLLFLLASALWRTATHPGGIVWRSDLSDGLTYGALFGLLFGLVFGLHPGWRDGLGDTRVGEAWEWSGWSARGALRGGAVGVTLLLLFWARAALDQILRSERLLQDTRFWLFFSLVFVVFGGLLGLFLGGFQPPGETPQSRRSRTLWRALRNFQVIAKRGLVGLCFLLWIGYGVFALSGAAQNIAVPGLGRKELLLLPLAPSILGFWLLLWAGGIDLVQHFTLRLLLAASGPMPFRWGRFLEFAADRALLRQEGASYTFYHRLLRDYFAALPDSKD